MKKVNYFLAGMMLIFAVSCVSPEEWSDKYGDIIPGPVSNVQVENLNGGARITYTLPAVKDLMGAKVAYSLTQDGEIMERWSSAEKDTILLEGYGDTNERTVTIYAVHKSGNVSVGVPVNIKPLTPPIFIMRETMKTMATFGGIQITWDNPQRKDMGIALYVEDSITHEMMLFDKYFSNAIYGKTAFRPFKPEEQNFRIEMFDRWQNYSQALDTIITPFEEIVISSRDERGIPLWTTFDSRRIDDDLSQWSFLYRCDIHEDVLSGYGVDLDRAIDWPNTSGGVWYPADWYPFSWYVPGTDVVTMPLPMYYTFDMGKKATYSRFRFLPFQRSPLYSACIPSEFDVWGCNDPKLIEDVEDPHGIYPKGSREANQAYWSSWALTNGTDAWKKDWVKLATCKIVLASGDNKYYDGVPLSAEDIAKYQSEGFEFDFNMDVTEAFRYLRWEVHATNTSQREIRIIALQYWGSYPDE